MAGWNQSHLQEEPAAGSGRMSRMSVQNVLQRSYSLFRSGFWRHFMTAWPPSVLAVLVYAAGDAVIRDIFSSVRYAGAEFQRRLLVASLEALPVRFLEFGLPWIFTAFAFAALSSRLLQASSENQRRIVDAYSLVRDRLRPIVAVGLITFVLTILGGGISIFCALALGGNKLVPPEYRFLAVQAVLWASFGGCLILVSRLALSIPCIMDDLNATAWRAIRTSFRLSVGYERLFLVFAAQTIGISFLIRFLDNAVSFVLWRNGITIPPAYFSAYLWSLRGLYSVFAAVVETSIFIGFTVLYMEMKDGQKENDQAEVSSEGISATALSPR